jgi:hypothetical protein
MNNIRTFALIAALLITAIFFLVIANGLDDDQAIQVTSEASHSDRPPAGDD